MNRLETPVTVESRLAWALLWIGVIIFLGALMWGFLSPHMDMMRETGGDAVNSTSGESQAAQDGWNIIMTAWSLWPLWFSLRVLFYGFRKSVNESRRTP